MGVREGPVMTDKALSAMAEATRCITIAMQAQDLQTKGRYLKLAESWRLIAAHHEARSEMDAKIHYTDRREIASATSAST